MTKKTRWKILFMILIDLTILFAILSFYYIQNGIHGKFIKTISGEITIISEEEESADSYITDSETGRSYRLKYGEGSVDGPGTYIMDSETGRSCILKYDLEELNRSFDRDYQAGDHVWMVYLAGRQLIKPERAEPIFIIKLRSW